MNLTTTTYSDRTLNKYSFPSEMSALGGFHGARKEVIKRTQHLRLDEAQGASEQRTEPYMQYGEGAAQRATQRFAKSAGKMLGFAKDLASAAGGLW